MEGEMGVACKKHEINKKCIHIVGNCEGNSISGTGIKPGISLTTQEEWQPFSTVTTVIITIYCFGTYFRISEHATDLAVSHWQCYVIHLALFVPRGS
jgi:hypothetical protein